MRSAFHVFLQTERKLIIVEHINNTKPLCAILNCDKIVLVVHKPLKIQAVASRHIQLTVCS